MSRPKTMKRTVILILFVVLLTITASGSAQSQINFDALERSIAEEMELTHTPGAAVAVVQGDRVVFQKGFGVTSVETKQSVTTDAIFRLGSTTKMFVAAAAITMVEAGKIKLDLPISEYVPELHPALKRLTLHQLLSHTAGLKDDAPMNGPIEESALGERVRTWNETAFLPSPAPSCRMPIPDMFWWDMFSNASRESPSRT